MKHLGMNCQIADDVKISNDVNLILGDHVFIGPGVRIVGKGTVKFDDYSKIHSGCFISVPHDDSIVEFGCNTWIGERSILDGTGKIIASHNVGVGIASHLYSHIAHGDVMAGCRFMSEKQLTIGIDAWFVGQCLVSPVDVGEKSMAMLGSTIVKDMSYNTIYAGVPAKDMTEKMGKPWDVCLSCEERLHMFDLRLKEYVSIHNRQIATISSVSKWPERMNDNITYFNVSTRTYTKRSTDEEIQFMKWLTSWRGRFTPEKLTTS